MTGFFGVHLVLTVVSLMLGTIIGVLGIRALRSHRLGGRKAEVPNHEVTMQKII